MTRDLNMAAPALGNLANLWNCQWPSVRQVQARKDGWDLIETSSSPSIDPSSAAEVGASEDWVKVASPADLVRINPSLPSTQANWCHSAHVRPASAPSSTKAVDLSQTSALVRWRWHEDPNRVLRRTREAQPPSRNGSPEIRRWYMMAKMM